jgi:hypothetical protein
MVHRGKKTIPIRDNPPLKGLKEVDGVHLLDDHHRPGQYFPLDHCTLDLVIRFTLPLYPFSNLLGLTTLQSPSSSLQCFGAI